jgi:hypothetical protein
MSNTFEIPKDRWTGFIATFNRALAGRPIRIEVMGRALGDQEMADKLPFQGLDFETKGTEAGTLTIHSGYELEALAHRVLRPSRIYLYQNDLGELEWLAIDEAGDARTLIHFEHIPELEAGYRGAP